MTRRFDLSRDGAFVPADRLRPGQARYDDAGRRVVGHADRRLLFADELPEEPGLEDVLVAHIAQTWTRVRNRAGRVAPAALAGGAWATAAAGQVSAATACQAATLCVLTVVGGSTLHYWQAAHSAKTQAAQPAARAEQARPAAVELADADPPPAPKALQAQAAVPLPAEPEPTAVPAHAVTVQEPLPLSPAAQDPGDVADAGAASAPVAGATVQTASIMEKVAVPEEPAAESQAPAPQARISTPKTSAPVRPRPARLAVRVAPIVHAPPSVFRVAPPVVARLVQPRPAAPHIVLTRFDMPRWLMQAHTPRPVTVMSPQPHALAKPHEQSVLTADADTDNDSDSLNFAALRKQQPDRPVLAVLPHRERFAMQYARPAYDPRAAYYPPSAYYQPYGYPYGPYGYAYGRY